MAKFKVGDKVRILDGSNIEDYRGGFTPGMKNHVGEVLTVQKVSIHEGRPVGYRLDNSIFMWDERGLELVKPETIVIYRKGSETIALDKSTGKKAIVRCCPEDTFDFETGAKLAFDRLFAKKQSYKVGDRVRIKTWERLRKEYGLDIDGDIKINPCFTKGMKQYCGNVLTIDYINASHICMHESRYSFSECMIECKVEDKPTYYNGKIIFTKGDEVFKTGHIYEVKDGQIKDPRDYTIIPRRSERLRDLEDVRDFFTATGGRKRRGGWSWETLELIEVKND